MNGNQGQPQIGKLSVGGKNIEICTGCNTPVGEAYSYQDADNRIWLKRSCQTCGAVFELQGPYRRHDEARPVRFK